MTGAVKSSHGRRRNSSRFEARQQIRTARLSRQPRQVERLSIEECPSIAHRDDGVRSVPCWDLDSSFIGRTASSKLYDSLLTYDSFIHGFGPAEGGSHWLGRGRDGVCWTFSAASSSRSKVPRKLRVIPRDQQAGSAGLAAAVSQEAARSGSRQRVARSTQRLGSWLGGGARCCLMHGRGRRASWMQLHLEACARKTAGRSDPPWLEALCPLRAFRRSLGLPETVLVQASR